MLAAGGEDDSLAGQLLGKEEDEQALEEDGVHLEVVGGQDCPAVSAQEAALGELRSLRCGRPAATRCWRRSPATEGAVLLVTHQEGPVQALQPQRFVLMPDGIADW